MYAITRDRPLKDEATYLAICEDLGINPEADSIYQLVVALENDIRTDNDHRGLTVNISGAWGVGKSSYVNVLVDRLTEGNLVVNARSMFYGNFDEYIDSFFGQFYKAVHDRFGIKLKELNELAKHITISLEARLNFGVFSIKANGSQRFNVRKNKSSDVLLAENSDLNKKLASVLPHRIVIVLDDIDRLKPYELITALRLIEVLRQLNGVVVIAVGNIKQMGDLLESKKIPDAHRYIRKVFDHRIHLRRSLRDIETAAHVMVRDLVGRSLDEASRSAISEAYYFLVLRLIIQNIRDLADQMIEPSNIGPTTGEYWDQLEAAGNRKLGPVYDQLRWFYSVKESKYTHRIWQVDDENIKGMDWARDGLALLTSRPTGDIKPWETQAVFRGILSASYWAQEIIPSPHDQDKVAKYDFSVSDDVNDMQAVYNHIDKENMLPRAFLGKQEPETRWSIARKFMADRGRDEMERDNSIPELIDLRLLKGFAEAVAERLEGLTAPETTELKKLEMFVECVNVYESLIRVEKGEL